MKTRLLIAAAIGLVLAGILLVVADILKSPGKKETTLQEQGNQAIHDAFSAVDGSTASLDRARPMEAEGGRLYKESHRLEVRRKLLQTASAWLGANAGKLSLLILVVGLIWPRQKPLPT